MSEQVDRDVLVEVLAGHEMTVTYEGRLAGCVTCRACRVMGEWTGVDTLSAVRKHDAHVLLDSDWLAKRDRRVAAEAIESVADDEDFAATCDHLPWAQLGGCCQCGYLRSLAVNIRDGERP